MEKIDIMETKKEKKALNPIVGWLLFTVLGFFIYMFLGTILIGGIAGAFFDDKETVAYLSAIAASLIYVIIYDSANRKTFDGVFKAQNMKLGFLTFTPFLVVMAIALIFTYCIQGQQANFSWKMLLVSLYAGICEEIVFRAVPAAHMMRCYNDEKKIMLVCILTSILFALVHCTNLLQGADLGFTFIQLGNAFALGMILCTAYLVSGSIIPCMIIHTLNDIIAFMSSDAYSSSGVFEAGNKLKTSDFVMVIVGAVLYIATAIWMLRKDKRKDVLDVWAKKWKKVEIAEEVKGDD